MAPSEREPPSCSVCFEPYEEAGPKVPKRLPCGHTFSLDCLRRIMEGGRIKCPLDNQFQSVPTRGPEDFQTNRDILELRTVVLGQTQVSHPRTTNN